MRTYASPASPTTDANGIPPPSSVPTVTLGSTLISLDEDEDPHERMCYEADVLGLTAPEKPRLVEQEEHANNIELWAELMRFRRRMDGSSGVQELWQAMCDRGLEVPTHGHVADDLWRDLLDAASHDWLLLEHMAEYVQEQRKSDTTYYDQFYQKVIGRVLRQRPDEALKAYRLMDNRALVPQNAASLLVEDVLFSVSADASFAAFTEIYELNDERNLYDQCITLLSQHDRAFEEAYAWHKLFVSMGDMSASTYASSFVRRMFDYDQGIINGRLPEYYMAEDVLESSSTDGRRSIGNLQSIVDAASGKVNSTALGRSKAIKEKSLSDEFCARLFATKTLHPSFLFSGVHMFGVDVLGPLTLREMALRSTSTSEFETMLDGAKQAGLTIANTTYAKALVKLAIEQQQELFDAMVKSDRHPDTYDNKSLQRYLLNSYVLEGDMVQARVMLKVLSMAQPDPVQFSDNLLLQACCKTRDMALVARVFEDMLQRKTILSSSSLALLRLHFLAVRNPGKRPNTWDPAVRAGTSSLAFVTNLYLALLDSGQLIEPTHLRELLKRYGMTDQLTLLERVCLKLTWYYRPDRRVQHRHVGDGSFYEKIFDSGLQRAIVAWGFKSVTKTVTYDEMYDEATQKPWAGWGTPWWLRCLVLLRTLGNWGVPLDIPGITKELKIRLLILHGPDDRTNNLANRMLRRVNGLSVREQMKTIRFMLQGLGAVKTRYGPDTLGDRDAVRHAINKARRAAWGMPEVHDDAQDASDGHPPSDHGWVVRRKKLPRNNRWLRAELKEAAPDAEEEAAYRGMSWPEQSALPNEEIDDPSQLASERRSAKHDSVPGEQTPRESVSPENYIHDALSDLSFATESASAKRKDAKLRKRSIPRSAVPKEEIHDALSALSFASEAEAKRKKASQQDKSTFTTT